MLNNIKLLFTNNYKVTLDQVSKDTSIDSLKIKLYREYSDHLPIPSNVFIENEEPLNNNNDNSSTTTTTTTRNDNDGNDKIKVKEQDDYYSKSHSTIVHQNQLRLIYGGKQLDNFSTLEDNGLESGDTILIAISPYISNYIKDLDKMLPDSNYNGSGGSISSDTVFLGIPNKRMLGGSETDEMPIFKLSINDRSYRQQQLNQDSSQSNIEKLNDNDTFKLLNRIKDNNNQDQFNNNSSSSSSSQQDVKLIPINNNINNNNSSSGSNNAKSLETLIDRLSLHDIPNKEINDNNIKNNRSKIDGNSGSGNSTNISSTSSPLTTTAIMSNPTSTNKKLEIQTFTPINEVSFCYFIKVIFNKPFLPLVNQSDNYEIPIKVEPALEHGKWTSIDGLVFEYKCVKPDQSNQSSSSSSSSLINDLFASSGSGGLFGSPAVYNNLIQFPLSTEFKVTIDSKRFKLLYNQDIEEKTYTFKTISQGVASTQFNHSFDNPQILVTFTQPIRFINNNNNNNNNNINYYDIFSVKSQMTDDIFPPKPLSFVVIPNNDPQNYYLKQLSDNNSLNESSMVLKITTNIQKYYSYFIHLSSNVSYVGSKCGPLVNNTIYKSKFQTQQLLKIYPVFMTGQQLSTFNTIMFESTCTLKSFDFIGAKKSNTLNNYIKIKPDIQINDIQVRSKTIYIYANFKPLKTYHVTLNNFKDIQSNQTSTSCSGFFSFPDYPQKIYLTKDSKYNPYVDTSLIYNLDPLYLPSVNVNTEGISKLLIKAYSVSRAILKKTNQIGKTISVPVSKNIIKHDDGLEEEERSTKTNIDLSKYFGTTLTKAKSTHSIILLKVKSYHDSKVKLSLLLQYSPLVVDHFELGNEVSLLVSNINTSKFYDQRELSITLYNESTLGILKPTYNQDKKSFEKDINFESSHLLVETKDGFSLLYQNQILKSSINKKYKDKWIVINAQGIYRPGDNVNIHGLIRLASDYNPQELCIPSYQLLKSSNLLSNSKATKKEIETIKYKVLDGKNQVLEGETLLDSINGSFDFKFELPLTGNLGTYSVELVYNEIYKELHYFEVQEFKRKQFLVESSLYTMDSNTLNNQNSIGYSETENPFSIQVLAKSYTGEIITNTLVEYCVTITPTFDTLTNNYSNYKFSHIDNSYIQIPEIRYTSKERNKLGRHHLDLVLQDSIYSCYVKIEATVIDTTNHRETITQSFFVKSDQLKYFGISKDIKSWVNSDEDLVLDMIVCDSKGVAANEGQINIKIKRIPWEEDLPFQLVFDHTIIPDKLPIIYRHKLHQLGHHRVSLTYKSDNLYSKTSEHHFDIYCMGKQTPLELNHVLSESTTSYTDLSTTVSTLKPKFTHTNKPSINLKCTLDKNKYQLNEHAILLITTSLPSANGFVFFIKSDFIIDKYPIQIASHGQIEFKFKITESYLFNTRIVVYLAGQFSTITNGITVKRVSNQHQIIPLNVDYKSLMQLKVEFIDLKKFQTPSQDSSIVVNVKDPLDNKPLQNAQVTMMIVDHSILDIRNHSIKNPLDYIYSKENQFYTQYGSSLDLTMFKVFDDIIEIKDEDNKDSNDEMVEDDFEIYINYFSGRSIILKVSNSTTIAQVKEMIKERDGLPDYTQRLFYLNKQLDNGYIGDYSIKPGSTIKLVIRLFGGGTAGEGDAKVINNDQQTMKAIRVRDNFNPLAHFETISTDSNGNATFNYKVPDNLTLYKVMVLATHKNGSFNTANDYFVSKLPIQVRPSAPRFLNHHDTATFPVTISNVLDFDLYFEGAVRSDNCKLLSDQGYKCKLPANSRITIPITCKALVPNSISNFQFVARTLLNIECLDKDNELCDAVSFKIPIKSSTSIEATTINNTLDNINESYEFGIHQLKFDNWQQLDTEVGGLSIQLNTDPLQKATISINDLINYSYLCSEQISSKLIALYTYIKNPSIFKLDTRLMDEESNKVVDKDSALKSINEMITTLKKRLTKNFGFRYWDSQSSKDYEYITMYVYWVLNQISSISDEAKYLVQDYFKKYINTSKVFQFNKTQFKEDGKRYYLFNKALSLFFYGQVYDKCPSIEFVEKLQLKAKKNLNSIQYHQFFIYLSPFLRSDPYYSNIINYINITGTLAHLDFDSSNSIYGFSSNVRCQAILILSLLEDKNKSHLLQKLVTGLSYYTSRDGYFYSTQDNAFNLIAISQYYSKYLNNLPTYTTTSIQLNNHYIEKNEIKLLNSNNNDDDNITTTTTIATNNNNNNNNIIKKKFETFLPLKQVLKNQSNIIIEKKSSGILFYTLNLSYAPLNPIVNSVSNRGFKIIRKFIPVLNNDDIVYLDNQNQNQNQLIPNIQIKAGSKVKISLQVIVESDSTFVAIKDRLPAGLEPIDSKSTQYNGYWCNHVNNRETGIEIFSDLLHKGTYYYNYYAIAITRGTFISPPVKIEEMYCSSRFGRSNSSIVLIK